MDELHLTQPAQGYRYNSDSLILADFALGCGLRGRVMDAAAGVGVVGLVLKKFAPQIRLALLEIQALNARLIRENLAANALEGEVFEGDLRGFKSENKFDFLVANPPFHRGGASQNEHKNMSLREDFLPFTLLCESARALLSPGGSLVFCYAARELGELLAGLGAVKFAPVKMRFIHARLGAPARLVLIHAKRRGGKSRPCEVLSPLFARQDGLGEEGVSEELLRIYTKFRLESHDL